MTDNTNAGTTDSTAQAPEAAATAAAPVTAPQNDEVTTLRSRNSGLDAKVTELLSQKTDAEKRAEDALKRLADYEAGKVGADEALRAQIAVKDAELAAVRREATLAKVAAAYPETFSVLGDAAANLSADQLADAEARFKGVPAESHTPPTPIGNNASRTAAPATKSIEEMTLAELKAYGPQAFKGLTWEAISGAD